MVDAPCQSATDAPADRPVSLPRRLVGRGGWLLLTASDEKLSACPPGEFAHGWVGLVIGSLAWGAVSIGLWEVALRMFGLHAGLPLMPVALLVPAAALGPYRRAVLATGRLLAGRDEAFRPVAACLVVLAGSLALLGIKGLGWRDEWPANLQFLPNWLRPRATYRILLLSPLWGAWAMLATLQLSRLSESAEPAVRRLAGSFGPGRTALLMVLPLVGSLGMLNYLPWWQVAIPCCTIISAGLGGWILGRLTGGTRRCTLLSVNLLTQWVFLLAYLSIRRAGRW